MTGKTKNWGDDKSLLALADVGEFQLIERMIVNAHQGQGVVKGPGDDAAVLDCGGAEDLLLTTDMLIEGVHFLRTMMSPEDIGRKALACSISDIAAMGGLPTFAVVSTAAPSNMCADFLERVGAGFNALAKEYGVSLVGGDMVKGTRYVINVALMGRVAKGQAVYRKGARPGDRIIVTGGLGNSFRNCKHLHFQPRVAEAQYLVRHARPTAMIDVSDGLAGDLGHILKQSGVGARLFRDRIPLAEGATVEQALADGEDFELLATVPADRAEALRKAGKYHFYDIGEITARRRLVLVDGQGRAHEIEARSFTHF